jgi:AraC-like DNA-binding protein
VAVDPSSNSPSPAHSVSSSTLTLSVDHLRESDRFAYWREEWCQATVGVTGELDQRAGRKFRARATSRISEHEIRLRCQTSPFHVSRGRREINRRGWESWIWLHQELSEGTLFEHAGNEFVTRRGDLLLMDPTIPFTNKARSAHDYRRWFLPRAWIEPHLSFDRRPLSIHLTGSGGLDTIVRSYLEALNETIDTLDHLQQPAVIDNLCRLLALSCGGPPGPQQGAIRAAKLQQAKEYISKHLTDPGLTPTQAAAAVKISVRQLHLLFEPTGTSFAEHVQSRRLEECRAALASPLSRDRSVTDIAFAWGFNSLASFYRAFRRRFGISPGEVRGGPDAGQG